MKLKDMVFKAIQEWTSKWDEKRIQGRVFSLLDQKCDEIIISMAGFSRRWNAWEVDHCNGRVSVVSEYISRTASQAVEDWIDQNVQSLPKVSDELRSVLFEDYKDVFLRVVKNRLRDLAVQDANTWVESLVTDLMNDAIATGMQLEETPKSLWE